MTITSSLSLSTLFRNGPDLPVVNGEDLTLWTRSEGSPGLQHRGDGRSNSQCENGERNPKRPKLLWITTIIPKLSPPFWRTEKDILIQFQKSILPIRIILQVQHSITGVQRVKRLSLAL